MLCLWPPLQVAVCPGKKVLPPSLSVACGSGGDDNTHLTEVLEVPSTALWWLWPSQLRVPHTVWEVAGTCWRNGIKSQRPGCPLRLQGSPQLSLPSPSLTAFASDDIP